MDSVLYDFTETDEEILVDIVPCRPVDLPEFEKPPLNEVAIGVQFEPPHGYRKILAKEVWDIFREEYPKLQEQQPLPPSFETFGSQHFFGNGTATFSLSTQAPHDRFWFLRAEEDELIQFQQDRFIHNWRMRSQAREYPRFESIAGKFYDEFNKLEEYMLDIGSKKIKINQCEINYVNHIILDPGKDKSFSAWLNFMNFSENQPDDFLINFREVIRDNDNKPRGRLYVEAALACLPDGNDMILLTLTVKGAPSTSDIESAMDFFSMGRNIIVRRFTQLTTEQVHKEWEQVN
jgi:uncharacterized protein (TIGR04255 family)